jgi:hypothetical protein
LPAEVGGDFSDLPLSDAYFYFYFYSIFSIWGGGPDPHCGAAIHLNPQIGRQGSGVGGGGYFHYARILAVATGVFGTFISPGRPAKIPGFQPFSLPGYIARKAERLESRYFRSYSSFEF